MQIRNFCIIAHIDHGKSTLADRLLEVTGTIDKRKMKNQFLDQLELERERGITIKMAPVRMKYQHTTNNIPPTTNNTPQTTEYILNLIDTPGHPDFGYEVSRALEAVEGAVLLVDGMQGIQAQTLSNLYSAQKAGLTIIGAVNKVDMHIPNIEVVLEETAKLIHTTPDKIHRISGKTGEGVAELLEDILRLVPPPRKKEPVPQGISRALIFDSFYDDHKGIIAVVRLFDGVLRKGMTAELMAVKEKIVLKEVGYVTPKMHESPEIGEGEIGYVVTGLKDPHKIKIGDTILVRNLRRTYTEPAEAKKLLYEELSYEVRGALFEVRKKLGFGHKESIYQNALVEELKKKGIPFDREKIIDVVYEDKKIGVYRPDFVIDEKIIIELKTLPFLGAVEKKQVWTYLKGSVYKLAFLVNFGPDDLIIERYLNDGNSSVSSAQVPSSSVSLSLPGYKEPNPVVFVSFFPDEADDYDDLKKSLERLKLNDSSFSYEPDFNEVLGRGFKGGFLGKLHFEIIAQRLDREFHIRTITSFPSVSYKLKVAPKLLPHIKRDEVGYVHIQNPKDLPMEFDEILEPVIKIELVCPAHLLGPVLGLQESFRWGQVMTESLGDRIIIRTRMPLAELISDFDDRLKSISGGFASFNYEADGYQKSELARMDILVAGELVPGLSRILPKSTLEREARKMVIQLKEVLPRQQFTQAIQAQAFGRFVARETIPAMKKDLCRQA